MANNHRKDPFAGLLITAGVTADERYKDYQPTAGAKVPIGWGVIDGDTGKRYSVTDPKSIKELRASMGIDYD